jgi:hypothetical protein
MFARSSEKAIEQSFLPVAFFRPHSSHMIARATLSNHFNPTTLYLIVSQMEKHDTGCLPFLTILRDLNLLLIFIHMYLVRRKTNRKI